MELFLARKSCSVFQKLTCILISNTDQLGELELSKVDMCPKSQQRLENCS